jgi:hypothetical protein
VGTEAMYTKMIALVCFVIIVIVGSSVFDAELKRDYTKRILFLHSRGAIKISKTIPVAAFHSEEIDKLEKAGLIKIEQKGYRNIIITDK